MIQWSRNGRQARGQLERILILLQRAHRSPCYLFYVLLYFLTMGIVREQYSKCHSRHFFIYACADSSEWGLFGRCARSAFRRTPSGRLICKTLFLYQRYTKGIQKADVIKYASLFCQVFFTKLAYFLHISKKNRTFVPEMLYMYILVVFI